ncbi:MAG TPA: carboxypeptidase-like regulatory domain-containing protein, partial [Blastocatellia bacterium]|nr:carboxypeptidase-like regulatory domain-containing protein [Blastocatellia bacterium]
MRYRSLLPVCMLIFALLILPPLTASAQTATTTTVSGTVTDATGAVVANATVKLTDTATNTDRTATTNSVG